VAEFVTSAVMSEVGSASACGQRAARSGPGSRRWDSAAPVPCALDAELGCSACRTGSSSRWWPHLLGACQVGMCCVVHAAL